MPETIESDETEEEAELNAQEDVEPEEAESEDAYDFPTPGGLRGL